MIPDQVHVGATPAGNAYDDLAAPFIDECWWDVLAHVRHLLSITRRASPPFDDEVACWIRSELDCQVHVEPEPRMRERMVRARPYVEARLTAGERPSISLVDILTTLDRLRFALARHVERQNSN
jgi:hypothetical protein